MSLLTAATHPERLHRALEELIRADAIDGRPSRPAFARLASDPDALARLAADASEPGWQPRPLVAIDIPKKSGGTRRLGLPCARERVLERSLLRTLTPLIDPHLGGASFGYRPGLGVGDAVRRVVALRDEGFGVVIRTDIDDCFPSVDRTRVLNRLAAIVGDDPVVGLVERLLHRPFRIGRFIRHHSGLPQGSALSPILSNLYLVAFDDAIQDSGFPLVRYADDCVVFARDRSEAWRAVAATELAAEALDMQLGADKTEVLDFETGFCFVGEDFNHRYPATAPDPSESPGRRVLYVGVQGTYVTRRQGRVVVTRSRKELLSVPSERVERIVCFGSVTIAPGLRTHALYNAIDVVFCSRSGRLTGWLRGTGNAHVGRRRDQYRATGDPAIARSLATEMIAAKLANQKVLLRRYVRPTGSDELAEIVAEIDSYAALLPTAETAEQALGVEGIVARRYFEGLGILIDDPYGFEGRSARPPADVVNAALSYGYAILTGEATTACVAAGLDPECGFLHTDRANRPSLALDLIEEFRPVIVDAAVLALVRRGNLTPDDGRPADGGTGVWLTEAGRRLVIAAVERRLLTRVHHPVAGRRLSLRRSIYVQAQQVAALVQRGHSYTAYRRRV